MTQDINNRIPIPAMGAPKVGVSDRLRQVSASDVTASKAKQREDIGSSRDIAARDKAIATYQWIAGVTSTQLSLKWATRLGVCDIGVLDNVTVDLVTWLTEKQTRLIEEWHFCLVGNVTEGGDPRVTLRMEYVGDLCKYDHIGEETSELMLSLGRDEKERSWQFAGGYGFMPLRMLENITIWGAIDQGGIPPEQGDAEKEVIAMADVLNASLEKWGGLAAVEMDFKGFGTALIADVAPALDWWSLSHGGEILYSDIIAHHGEMQPRLRLEVRGVDGQHRTIETDVIVDHWLAETPTDRQEVLNEYILKEAEAAGIKVYVAKPEVMR